MNQLYSLYYPDVIYIHINNIGAIYTRTGNFSGPSVENTKGLQRQSGARSAPGNFLGYSAQNTNEIQRKSGARCAPGILVTFCHKHKGNTRGIRRAKRAGKTWGIPLKKQRKYKGNPAREARRVFLGVF